MTPALDSPFLVNAAVLPSAHLIWNMYLQVRSPAHMESDASSLIIKNNPISSLSAGAMQLRALQLEPWCQVWQRLAIDPGIGDAPKPLTKRLNSPSAELAAALL
ncbi:Nuclear factor of activated T-cells, cytoplasmic 2 [Platysternon megacephalum]|uniref:Nuclear factor of activated T-cells, cytoplasmic 2 n=1 Tax=Platysternon megacephalum TaxID=55544 RepID=A0A4D9DIX1_9SAUR|nr:Nuclear factor of activated T-cells, cytoplasmic 2 [Platysternon megacephalum]